MVHQFKYGAPHIVYQKVGVLCSVFTLLHGTATSSIIPKLQCPCSLLGLSEAFEN